MSSGIPSSLCILILCQDQFIVILAMGAQLLADQKFARLGEVQNMNSLTSDLQTGHANF